MQQYRQNADIDATEQWCVGFWYDFLAALVVCALIMAPFGLDLFLRG